MNRSGKGFFSLKTIKCLFLFSLLLSCFSCSSESEFDNCVSVSETAIISNNSPLLTKLQSFNDSLMNDNVNDSIIVKRTKRNITFPPKSDKKAWINLYFIDCGGGAVGASVGGFLGGLCSSGLGAPIGQWIGGLGGAALASWAACPDYVASDEDKVFNDILISTRIMIDDKLRVKTDMINFKDVKALNRIFLPDSVSRIISLPEDAQQLGLMHNVALSKIDGSISLNEPQTSTDEILIQKEMESSFLKQMDYSIQMVSSDDFKEQFNKNLERFVYKKEAHSKIEQALLLLDDVVKTYVNETIDIVFIVNKYKEMIEQSDELSQEEKDCIYAALATAIYSYNYWYNKASDSTPDDAGYTTDYGD